MENLRRLQECNKKTTTLKRAFSKFGEIDHNKKLKDMDEKEEFGALVNWALNELPSYEHMYLRCKVDGQTSIRKRHTERVVGKPKVKDCQDEAITYDWPEHATYENLDEKIIAISALRANVKNEARKQGKELAEEEIQVFPQIDWAAGLQQKDGEKVMLTEEEMELINEFLQV